MIEIREAREDDIEQLKEVVASSISELCKGHYTPVQLEELLGQYPGKDVYRKWLRERVLIVATNEAGVVGFAQFNPSHESLEAVHVSPEHAGKGIGKSLVRGIEEKARRLGVRKVFVDSSLNAAGFYSSCDYVRIGPSKYQCRDGIELETVRFEKEIDR